MSLAWVALNAVKGLGPVRIRQLLELYETPEDIFRRSAAELTSRCGISPAIARALHDSKLFLDAEQQIRKAEQAGIQIVTLADAHYPSLLREIFAPPPVLYVRGALDIFSLPAIAVVGTRKPTQYGQSAASSLVSGLVSHNIAIISGLALGIDAGAHQSCLDSGGRTAAVLGCGVDQLTPASNRKLGERILEHGAVVSEFPIGAPPEPYNFPRRNRIISGLASGVVVVEAGIKSGALITAQYALQQGREVFAVPGSVFSDRSEGTFRLITSGATPVRGAADIVEALSTMRLPAVAPSPALSGVHHEQLSGSEAMVLEELDSEPLRIDQLAERTQRILSELFDILLNLELKGFIRQTPGQQYIRV